MNSELLSQLQSIMLFEKDKNGDTFMVWGFPDASDDERKVALDRTRIEDAVIPAQFGFSKFRTRWMYWFCQSVDAESSPNKALERVAAYAIVLWTSNFHPERYCSFLELASRAYGVRGTPVVLADAFLSSQTQQVVDLGELGRHADGDFDVRRSLLATSLKEVVRMFDLEIALLWTALMTRKRVVVFCENVSVLLRVVRGIPALVWHRQNWNILRPLVNLNELELSDLAKAGVYVAGFTDPAVKTRADLYDLLVDLNEQAIEVPEHAVSDFKMGSIHRDVATFLTSAAEADASDQAIIKELLTRNKNIISKLESIREPSENGQAFVTADSLMRLNLPSSMVHFLYAVAAAEQMTAVTN